LTKSKNPLRYGHGEVVLEPLQPISGRKFVISLRRAYRMKRKEVKKDGEK